MYCFKCKFDIEIVVHAIRVKKEVYIIYKGCVRLCNEVVVYD